MAIQFSVNNNFLVTKITFKIVKITTIFLKLKKLLTFHNPKLLQTRLAITQEKLFEK